MKKALLTILSILTLTLSSSIYKASAGTSSQTIGTCCSEECSDCVIYFGINEPPKRIPFYYWKAEGPC